MKLSEKLAALEEEEKATGDVADATAPGVAAKRKPPVIAR